MSHHHENALRVDAAQTRHTLESSEAGTIGTGIAILGFLFSFLAGTIVAWGWTHHELSFASGGDSSGTTATWSDDDSPFPISSKDPMWGKREALVTIVQFSDFQCPFCARVEPAVEQIKKSYTQDQIRIVWKNNPLPMHPNAKPAAEAGAGVFALKGADAFFKFHDRAFANQGALTGENFEKWAAEAGVDLPRFRAGMAAHTWADKVERDLNVVKQAGFSMAPAFSINGVPLTGAQAFDKFKTVIDAELVKATAKVKSGTSRDHVYVAMSQENKRNTPPPAADNGPKEDPNAVFKVPVGTSPALGNPQALVTIALFSDFQCPYCGRVEATMKTLREKYGDKLRIVWKDAPLPFHNRAEPAAEVAHEARVERGDTGFWEAHDKLFARQSDLSDTTLASIATELHLNPEKVKAAIADHKYKKDIDEDMALANALQAGSKPHMFINGRRLVGAGPIEGFTKLIDEELKKAEELVAKGTPAALVYERTTKDGKLAAGS